MKNAKRYAVRILVLLVVAAVAYGIKYVQSGETGTPALPESSSARPAAGASSAGAQTAASGEAELLEAFRDGRSDVWIEAAGVVDRVLPDDDDGSRHQRFILKLASGHTVLVAHNIDLAPRVPLDAGDRISFRGEYEWNDRGGVVHWTHHDPAGRREGGWLEHRAQRYK